MNIEYCKIDYNSQQVKIDYDSQMRIITVTHCKIFKITSISREDTLILFKHLNWII